MTERMRGLLKNRSGSKISLSAGSVKHIGTTPYRFRVDVFISSIDRVNNATSVCVTWERRGRKHGTRVKPVTNGKAEIRETLSMQCTFFRKTPKSAKRAAASNDDSEVAFDEKRAKFFLRKGAADGKAMGKVVVDLAKYIKETNSTVFADLKLSNGSVAVCKIEAFMLHIGKKNKTGSQAGSDTLSEMTDVYEDDDSIFGDVVTGDLGDLEQATRMPSSYHTAGSSSSTQFMSPVSITPTSPLETMSETKTKGAPDANLTRPESITADSLKSLESSTEGLVKNKNSTKGKEGMKESPSIRNKLKNKLKERKAGRKEKSRQESKVDINLNVGRMSDVSATTTKISKRDKPPISPETVSEMKELKAQINAVTKEKDKLKIMQANAREEIEILKAELEAGEVDLEEQQNKSSKNQSDVGTSRLSRTIKEKEKRITELEAQNESLLEELEELNDPDQANDDDTLKLSVMQKKIDELEVALRREPRFLDVVNELKVTKMSLALANMEKEQALFQLQALHHKFGIIAE